MVRFKHRYLLVHLVFPDQLQLPSPPSSSTSQPALANSDTKSPQASLTESGLIGLLRDSLSVNFGDIGAGEVGGTFSIKYLSPTTSTVIIRVAREHYRTLWAALTLLRKVGGHECIARVVHVSGTIRKTQHSAIAHDRTQILLLAAAAASSRQRRRKRQLQQTASSSSSSFPSPLNATTAAADTKANEEAGDDEVRRLLGESEARIRAMEA
ncbi:hypothetical protein C6P46_004450 [Rhodotorula mucilaginosa]|uniref:Uncharacterized protein n=1 Tax=Rhodotorula mucilaginosa TaxID=5537 RepID=A0A9P6W2R1_RHOMI|nr:hypothetical protein C6P46_004450 [Rhodotorula mucilaginosa]